MNEFQDLPVIFGKEPVHWDDVTATLQFALYTGKGDEPPIGRIIFMAESLIELGENAKLKYSFLVKKKTA